MKRSGSSSRRSSEGRDELRRSKKKTAKRGTAKIPALPFGPGALAAALDKKKKNKKVVTSGGGESGRKGGRPGRGRGWVRRSDRGVPEDLVGRGGRRDRGHRGVPVQNGSTNDSRAHLPSLPRRWGMGVRAGMTSFTSGCRCFRVVFV